MRSVSFSRSHLEALRQPLEERSVALARVRASVVFPAEFVLVAAANPCPCGRLGELSGPGCRCPEAMVTRYQSRLSGPMRDRIDMIAEVPRLNGETLLSGPPEEPTARVRQRVATAQGRQLERAATTGVTSNALLDGDRLLDVCRLDARGRDALTTAGERWRLSARAYHRLLRVSRTIADLAGEDRVSREAVIEAFQLRIPAL
jgi:magnesium chelatase family protein